MLTVWVCPLALYTVLGNSAAKTNNNHTMTERERLIETYAKRFWNARHVAAIRELLNEFESDLVSLNRGSDETQAVRPNEQTKEGCELCMGNGVIESDWDGGGFTAKCDCKAN